MLILLYLECIFSAPSSSLIDATSISITGSGEVSSSIARSKGNYKSIKYAQIDGPSSLLQSAFANFQSLESILISSTVIEIGSYCFSGCSSLTEFTFPESVTTINSYLFENCVNLTNVTLSSTISMISERIFEGCSSLSYFEVSEDSKYFTTDPTRKFLLSKNATVLFAVSSEENLEIPNTVKVLNSNCFTNNEYSSINFFSSSVQTILSYSFRMTIVDSLAFPNTLLQVDNRAFYQSDIRSLSFPSSIKSFHESALHAIRKLEMVNAENGTALLSINGLIVDSKIKIIHFVNPIENVSIPASIETVLIAGILSNKVQNVFVDPNNKKFFSYDGALYLSSGYILQACPGGKKKLTFHEKCKSTASESFLSGSIERIVVNEGFEQFGMHCFGSCFNLVSINFPLSLKVVYSWSFNYCTNLNIDIVLGKKVDSIGEYSLGHLGAKSIDMSQCEAVTEIEQYTFRYTKAKKIILPPKLLSINEYAFIGTSIEEIVFPSTLKTLKTGCFLQCSNLSNVIFSDSKITAIPDSCFDSTGIIEIKVPSSVVSLGSNCFANCANLTNIIFEPYSALTTIYPNIIYGCEKVTNFEFGKNLTTINEGAFAGSIGISDFELPSYLKNYIQVNGLIIETTTKLVIAVPGAKKDVIIDKDIKSISILAFSGCIKLVSVSFEQDSMITELTGSIFENCYELSHIVFSNTLVRFDTSLFRGCAKLQTVRFLGSSALKEVNDDSFKSLTSLVEFDFLSCEKLERIGSSAFEGCINLKSINFIAINVIDQRAFFGCTKLAFVRLPATVTTVSLSAFESCTNLRVFQCCSNEVTASDCLSNTSVSFVYVPFEYIGSKFGILPVLKSLDDNCLLGTSIFTFNVGFPGTVAPFIGLLTDQIV